MRDRLAMLFSCLLLLCVGWGILFLVTSGHYTYYDGSGRITRWSIAGGKSPVASNDEVDTPAARAACAKEPPLFLIRPFRYLVGEIPCYHEPGR